MAIFALALCLFSAPPSFETLLEKIEAREKLIRNAAVRMELDTELGGLLGDQLKRHTTSAREAFDAKGLFIFEGKTTLPLDPDIERQLPANSPAKGKKFVVRHEEQSYDGRRTLRLEHGEDDPGRGRTDPGWMRVGSTDPRELLFRSSGVEPASVRMRRRKWEPLIEDSKGMIVCQSVPSTHRDSPAHRGRLVFVVDPKRGWIISDARNQLSDRGGPWRDRSVSVWLKSAEVQPGIWAPLIAEYRGYNELGGILSRCQAKFTDWKINIDLPADAFQIKIQPGTPMTDGKTGEFFRWSLEDEKKAK